MVLYEVFLSAFLQVLFDRLASPEVLSFVRQYGGLKKKLDKWKDNLQRIQKVLDDADEKQYEDVAVKLWVDNLRDLAYDVEDILDEFSTDTFIGGNQASTSKVRKLTPACCTPFTPRAVKTKINLGTKIKKITDRFNDIVKEKNELSLREIFDPKKRGKPSTSLVDEKSVYGREGDKKAILKFLLGEKYNHPEVCVIPIHGMGGVGKTTLAQFVFNDDDVQMYFDVKVWTYVSDDYVSGDLNVFKLTKKIFASVVPQTCEVKEIEFLKFKRDGDELDLLQCELQKQLFGRKFLVILDDVRTYDYDQWNNLRAPFLKGNAESRIIITTRDREVSSKMGTVPPHSLEVLSDEDCLSVFTHHALAGNSLAPNLQGIGQKISKKCKGLPLAAYTFGGLLHSNEELDHRKWEEVSKRRILEAPKEREKILTVLMWSYADLPLHLKRCFAHCSIIPEGYEFEEKQLVLLWMAEGLIQAQRDKQMEDVGSEYFEELVKKSFFQKSSMDGSRFKMHDFINNLAQWVAGNTCFRMENRSEEILKKARHLSYLCGCNCPNNFEALFELRRLRTFLPLVLPNQGTHSLTCNVSCQLLPKLGCVRVLSLSGYHITELSDSIGDLKHLRYLDLSHTSIESMPESTATLQNLQTLILENCHALKKLPSMFRNLVNLRHLNIRETCSLEGMPPQMGKLTCLQTLSDLIVGADPCSGVKELGPLSHLRETLCISRLENVIQPGDATDANLKQKTNLDGLWLEWSCNLNALQHRTSGHYEVLNKLEPHNDLKELTIKCYGGIDFPTWLTTPSFPNMVRLRLENCKKCTSLPPVGQLPSLKDLSIIGMVGVQEVGPEFYEGGRSLHFGSLETLCFENMEKWENWNPCVEFSHLRELSIQNCPNLSGKLPNRLPLLESYEINGCPLLQERPMTRVVQNSSQAGSSV